MQISQSSSPLYTSKAQQAWEARRAAKAAAPEGMFPAAAATAIPPKNPPIGKTSGSPENSRADVPTVSSAPVSSPLPAHLSTQWEGKVRDIQNIAAKAGFVDVSEQAIRRAYLQGESLLADYRV